MHRHDNDSFVDIMLWSLHIRYNKNHGYDHAWVCMDVCNRFKGAV